MQAKNELTLKREAATLQFRRDFLQHYAEQFQEVRDSNVPKYKKNDHSTLEDYINHLKTQVQMYTDFLKSKKENPSQPDYLDIVLAEKKASADAGISRSLRDLFAPLIAKRLNDKEHPPFVQLDPEDGLCFYFNRPQDAREFKNMLQDHDFIISEKGKKIPDSLLPEDMKKLPESERFQGPGATMASIPHCQIKKLLTLAQYHSYEVDKVIKDLYEGKVDRTEALLNERKNNIKLAEIKENPTLFIPASVYDKEQNIVQISLSAKTHSKQKTLPPHYVFILDDSGSMAGTKINALNTAMKELLQKLPEDALVSIIPLNAAPIAHRDHIGKITWKSLKAGGGTPLIERTSSSIPAMKKEWCDPLVSKEELERTMLIVLSDGQPNGGDKTVGSLMENMQNGYQYREIFGQDSPHKVMMMPVSIGADGDTAFMRDMAEVHHTPHAFIRDDSAKIDHALKTFLNQLLSLKTREASASVVVSYVLDGNAHSKTVELQNLFHGYKRQIFVEVPKGAENVSVSLLSENQFIAPKPTKTEPLKARYLTEYIFGKYSDLRVEFESLSSKVNRNNSFEAFWDRDSAIIALGIGVIYSTTRGAPDIIKDEGAYATDPAGWKVQKEKLDQLHRLESEKKLEWEERNKNDTLLNAYKEGVKQIESKIDQLLSIMPTDQTALTAVLTLFKNELHAPKNPESGHASLYTSEGREAVARFSQLRFQGMLIDDSEVIHDNLSQAIKGKNIEAVKKVLSEEPELDNKKMPLLIALTTLRETKDDPAGAKAIFDLLLKNPQLNLLAVDQKKDSVAHKAAWWGMEEPLLAIIEEAKNRNQLQSLEALRNTTHIGGTTAGERLFENILFSSFKADQKHRIFKALYGSTWRDTPITEQKWELFTDPNLHFSPDGLTPLMTQLKWLRETKDETKRAEIHKKIMAYLDANKDSIDLSAQSFNGNTALHFAFYNEEFAIARKILHMASEKGKSVLNDVLFARNNQAISKTVAGKTSVHSGGEIPYMNFIATMKSSSSFQSVILAFEACMHEGTETEQQKLHDSLIKTLNKKDPLASSNKALKKLLKKYPQHSDKILSAQKHTEASLLFPELYQFINENIDSAAQTELVHLKTTYEKELEGYCAFNFLKQAPVIKATAVKETLDTIPLPKALKRLPELLTQFKSTMNPELGKEIHEMITAYETASNNNVPDKSIHDVLTQAKILVAQQNIFQKNLVDTLLEKIKPLIDEQANLQKELNPTPGFFNFLNTAYRMDISKVADRLNTFITSYKSIVTTFDNTSVKDKTAFTNLSQSLQNLFTDPENQIFKKHPGIFGLFKDLMNWIAQTIFDSDYFQTATETSVKNFIAEVNRNIIKSDDPVDDPPPTP